MAKIRLYLQPDYIKKDIEITKKRLVHKITNVLRLEKGQNINIFNGEGKEWEYKIAEIKKKSLLITQIKKNKGKSNKKYNLALGFPLIQEKKIDFILQKATELGVTEFIPFISSRTLNYKVNSKKIERWQKIIIEACRQSERLWMPVMNCPLKLKELTEKSFDLKLIALPNKNTNTIEIKRKPKEMLCIVGPEGGFSNNELADFKKNYFNPIVLSSNILRTETAAIFLPGLIQYLVK